MMRRIFLARALDGRWMPIVIEKFTRNAGRSANPGAEFPEGGGRVGRGSFLWFVRCRRVLGERRDGLRRGSCRSEGCPRGAFRDGSPTRRAVRDRAVLCGTGCRGGERRFVAFSWAWITHTAKRPWDRPAPPGGRG